VFDILGRRTNSAPEQLVLQNRYPKGGAIAPANGRGASRLQRRARKPCLATGVESVYERIADLQASRLPPIGDGEWVLDQKWAKAFSSEVDTGRVKKTRS